MVRRGAGWVPLLVALSLPAAGAPERCELLTSAPVSITMDNLRPVVPARINGVAARFLVDTGSPFQFLSRTAAAEFKLPLTDAPPAFYGSGFDAAPPKLATVKRFSIADMPAHATEFLVSGSDYGNGIAGLMGQNLLRIVDVDYDFANGVLRFIKPKHCGSDELVYWTRTQPFAVVDLQSTTVLRPQLIAAAQVNGRAIRVMFDTGTTRSILSLQAAKRAGIAPGSPGVVLLGEMWGEGPHLTNLWSVPIAEFDLGGEKVKHMRALVADLTMFGWGFDMILGSDFFLSHHVYVANSQAKLYFTYNGGPVFDQTPPRPARAGGTSGTAADGGPDAAPPPRAAVPVSSSDTPPDAAGLMRRGLAYASRREFPLALADLTRACALASASADCRYQRGLAYWHSGQPVPALADFDAAIQLDPNDYEARLARAQLELPRRPAAVEDDLDAVDRLAPKAGSLRLDLARLYETIGQHAEAVHQYDLWLDYHEDDWASPFVRSDRCGSEAAANLDLDRALDDCNAALNLYLKSTAARLSAIALGRRSLVYLRRGELDQAIADDDAALKLQPRLPAALYARGLAELRKGLKARGETDIAAARAQSADIAKRFASMGLTP